MVPRVSIGMPVYNGQRYIAEAIDSLLAQTMEDFELIISDNGSDDRTEAICRDYAARDRRIRYYRSDVNRGAAWNFNHVVRVAKADLFKWAAHDDLCTADLLGRCVDVMAADERVVLCHSRVRLIDAVGATIGDHPARAGTEVDRPDVRLRDVLTDRMCFAIFGLIRRECLLRTGLLGNYAHADGILLTRLCLQGPFRQIDEHLFLSRRHREQSAGVMQDKYMYTTWFDPAKDGRIVLPNWRIHYEYLKAVSTAPVTVPRKLRCGLVLARECISDRGRLARDLVTATRMMLGRRPSRLKPARSEETQTCHLEGGGR